MAGIALAGVYGKDCPKCGSWKFRCDFTTIGEDYGQCQDCGYAEKASDPKRYKKVGNKPFKRDNYWEDPDGAHHKHGNYGWHKITVTHQRVEGEVYSFAELVKEATQIAPKKEKPKKSGKIAGHNGWFVLHTIKGKKYWYRHWYDRTTKKMKTEYVGKTLPQPKLSEEGEKRYKLLKGRQNKFKKTYQTPYTTICENWNAEEILTFEDWQVERIWFWLNHLQNRLLEVERDLLKQAGYLKTIKPVPAESVDGEFTRRD